MYKRQFIDSGDVLPEERRAGARTFLERNYAPEMCERMWSQLVRPEQQADQADRDWARDVTICKSCSPHVEKGMLRPATEIRLCDYAVDPVFTITDDDGENLLAMHERWEDHGVEEDDETASATEHLRTRILGRSVDDFAPAVALLTDHEEMVIALVHPLVQVYTIPRTGQLAYVGHICNFRQKVAKFLTSLPIPKKDFPFVMVRPRSFQNRPSTKALFKIDVCKLHDAFLWFCLLYTSDAADE